MFGRTSIEKKVSLKSESKTLTLPWNNEENSAILISTNPNFPVQVTRNKMYSVIDYITEIGGQYSVLAAIVAFIAQRFLYPTMVKEMGEELKPEEIKSAE